MWRIRVLNEFQRLFVFEKKITQIFSDFAGPHKMYFIHSKFERYEDYDSEDDCVCQDEGSAINMEHHIKVVEFLTNCKAKCFS